MIQHSADRFAQAVASRLGPLYQLFLFPGTPPTSIEEVPWSPVDIVSSEYPNQKGIDYNWIYSNMVSYVFCTATCDGTTRYDNVVFTHEVNDAGKPKMSYYDIVEKKYRHIPQTLDTDLSKYDYYSGNNSANNNKPHLGMFWPDGVNNYARFQIPSEDRTNGFYIEGDFGYEATINEIRWTGLANNNFEGDLLIYRWDAAANAGDGDWVLFYTHTMVDGNLIQDIVLPEDYVTTKYRFEIAEGNISVTNTIVQMIEFFGTEPDTNPVIQDPITWGVLAPVRPNRRDFYDFSMESPYMIVTAGGPADNVEMRMSQQIATPGRVNSLLSGRFQFASKEY